MFKQKSANTHQLYELFKGNKLFKKNHDVYDDFFGHDIQLLFYRCILYMENELSLLNEGKILEVEHSIANIIKHVDKKFDKVTEVSHTIGISYVNNFFFHDGIVEKNISPSIKEENHLQQEYDFKKIYKKIRKEFEVGSSNATLFYEEEYGFSLVFTLKNEQWRNNLMFDCISLFGSEGSNNNNFYYKRGNYSLNHVDSRSRKERIVFDNTWCVLKTEKSTLLSRLDLLFSMINLHLFLSKSKNKSEIEFYIRKLREVEEEYKQVKEKKMSFFFGEPKEQIEVMIEVSESAQLLLIREENREEIEYIRTLQKEHDWLKDVFGFVEFLDKSKMIEHKSNESKEFLLSISNYFKGYLPLIKRTIRYIDILKNDDERKRTISTLSDFFITLNQWLDTEVKKFDIGKGEDILLELSDKINEMKMSLKEES